MKTLTITSRMTVISQITILFIPLFFIISSLSLTSEAALSDSGKIEEYSDSTHVISPELREKIEKMHEKEKIHVLVTMKDQADLRHVRGKYLEVRKRLQEVADKREERTEHDSIRQITNELVQRGEIENVEKYWLVNAYSFYAKKSAFLTLVHCSDIASIDPFPVAELNVAEEGVTSSENLETYYGPTHVKAPEAWQMGYTGEDVLVGVIDKGVWAEHPALQGKMKVLEYGPDAGKLGFFDGEKVTDPYPDKLQDHGTHVTGIVVGGKAVGGSESVDATKGIGVAPGAHYLFALYDNAVASMQWMADPDGNPMTLDFPVAINNSWGIEDSNIQTWMDNLEFLGITVVFSAGNSGKLGPKSISGIHKYPTAFLVANIMENNEVNPGSSQGPAVYLFENFTKPDVAAPGTSILSSVFPGAYEGYKPDLGSTTAIYKFLSGTSMASPMVTGVIALVQDAYFKNKGEYLAPSKVKCILQITATNLGDDQGKDTKTGSGLVNAKAAIDLALNHVTVSGGVKDILGDPISFVKIKFLYNGLKYELYTNVDGQFELALPNGLFELSFEKLGYESDQLEVNTTHGQNSEDLEINLQPIPVYLVVDESEFEILAGVGGSTKEILTLANVGIEVLQIDEVIHTNPHISFKNKFPILLKSGQSAKLIMIYSPQETGEEMDVLSFASNSSVNPTVLVKGIASSNLFVDVAIQANLDDHPYSGNYVDGFGDQKSAWADLDENGLADVFVGKGPFPENCFLAMNQGNGTFAAPQDMNGLSNILSTDFLFLTLFIDIDNDGDQDLCAGLMQYMEKGVSYLTKVVLNSGDGSFNDFNEVTTVAGLPYDTVLDIDNNGLLDIVKLLSDTLFIRWQTKPLDFTTYSEKKIPFNDIPSLYEKTRLVFDFDNDTKMELLAVASDEEKITLKIIKNLEDNPVVEDLPVENIQNGGSLALSDYDNDGDMDIYVQVRQKNDGSFAKDWILRNEGGQYFYIVESPYIPKDKGHNSAGAPVWVDYNNDGYRDLFFAYGKYQYNKLFKNLGNGQFVEVAKIEGIHGLAGYSSQDSFGHTVCVDYDKDGDMDFFVIRKSWYDVLYRNNYYEHGGINHWVDIKLIGTKSNRDAIGARVLLSFKDGTLQSDQVLPSHQSFGQDMRTIHFGLGERVASDIEKLEIYWPSGINQTVMIKDVDQLIKILEKESNTELIPGPNPAPSPEPTPNPCLNASTLDIETKITKSSKGKNPVFKIKVIINAESCNGLKKLKLKLFKSGKVKKTKIFKFNGESTIQKTWKIKKLTKGKYKICGEVKDSLYGLDDNLPHKYKKCKKLKLK